ncbi:hypothetical protein QEN19_001242 [Hanseniaspora menglaensis]
MANKRRPKKFKPPYKKYVGGIGYVTSSQIIVNGIIVDKSKYLYLQEEDEYERPVIDMMGKLILDSSDYSKQKHEKQNKVSGIANSKLPIELYSMILDYMIDMDNDDNFNMNKPEINTKAKYIDSEYSLVCKDFYLVMLPRLYNTPNLTSRNFKNFIDTLDEDKKLKRNIKKIPDNIVTPKHLASFVKILDLSMIIQSGKNSIISKLLRRCSSSLIEFIAPQTSFGTLSLTTLRSCLNLKSLNLQLVAEKVDLNELFTTLNKFSSLKHVALPRAFFNCELLIENFITGRVKFEGGSVWPPNLVDVTLCGNVTNSFISICFLPTNLKKLSIAYCPLLDDVSIYKILDRCAYTLETIHFGYPLTKLRSDSLDDVLRYCSGTLKELTILVDYISKYFFLDDSHVATNLQTLTLDCSGSLSQLNKLHPDDLTIALVENRFPALKTIYLSAKIGWDLNSDDVQDLISVFEDQDGSIYMTY